MRTEGGLDRSSGCRDQAGIKPFTGGYTIWWLRSPYPSNQNNAGIVQNNGTLNNNNVNDARFSARPALSDKLEIRVKVYLIQTIR